MRVHSFACFLLVEVAASAADRPPQALVLADPSAALGSDLAQIVSAPIAAAGYAINSIHFDGLCQTNRLLDGKVHLLVLPDARRLPFAAVAPIETYLKSGGHLLALGLPAWESPIFQMNGRWWSRQEYEAAIAVQGPAHVLVDFRNQVLSQWTRQANDGTSPTSIQIESEGQDRVLHVAISDLTGWDTVASPILSDPFPAVDSLTCFRAKGDARTSRLSIEWTEADGSRWIAVVELTPEWKQYALPPEAFKPWEPRSGRGGPRDHLRVENARRFIVGLAFSHTAVGGGRHEYWLNQIGTAPNPFGAVPLPEMSQISRLETLCPNYLFFPLAQPLLVSIPDDMTWTGLTSPQPLGVWAGSQPRPRGVGFRQGRPWRWQPLLEARSPQGYYRGAIATLLVNAQAPFRRGVWTAFTPTNREFYRQAAMQKIIRETASRLREGLFLLEGGSEFFTLFENQSCRLGARIANYGSESSANLTVRLSVIAVHGGDPAFSRDWPIHVAPGQEQTVEAEWTPREWPTDGYTVQVDLLSGDRVVDSLLHPLNVWRPKPNPSFIEARDGGFWLAGKAWKAHGVNYMPSSGIGVASDYFEYWLGRGAYDPDVIQRDLDRIRAMHLNSVSVFVYYRSLSSQHLLDFLWRCDALGLHVNQSLRPGTPLDFRWPEMKALIEHYRLPQNDTVFAYDLAWEPSHYNHERQKAYRPAWTQWVLRRYGEFSAAEKAWGIPAPYVTNSVSASLASPTPDSGEIVTRPTDSALRTPPSALRILEVPSSHQLFHDGLWRKFVADYRAFLDAMLRDRYAEARRLVRSIDPHHPVSFRMQLAGDPTHAGEGLLPYDFYGLSDAVDIWEPEAYGRIGDWERVKPGVFTAAYARLCDPLKPVLWAEMGYNVWDMGRMAPDPAKLDFAARFYRDFYRMMRQSGADGVFFWWYPGGFRLNENSDFGIINADGTDRVITRVIRDEAENFLTTPEPPLPNMWLEVDRDQDARGLPGIYGATKNAFWKAIDDGKAPGLKWRRKPGS